MKTSKIFILAATIFCFALAALSLSANRASAGNYGCFKVVDASSVNIRKRAWSRSEVIGTASRGEVLVKWKAFCALRGFWCPVQKGSIKGHAAKKYLEKVDCP